MNCDFCYVRLSDFSPWTYITDTFVLPDDRGFAAYEEEGKCWAACDPCADLIEAGDWERFIERATAMDPVVNKTTREDVTPELAAWWKRRIITAFREHLHPGRVRGLPVWVAETQTVEKLLSSRP